MKTRFALFYSLFIFWGSHVSAFRHLDTVWSAMQKSCNLTFAWFSIKPVDPQRLSLASHNDTCNRQLLPRGGFKVISLGEMKLYLDYFHNRVPFQQRNFYILDSILSNHILLKWRPSEGISNDLSNSMELQLVNPLHDYLIKPSHILCIRRNCHEEVEWPLSSTIPPNPDQKHKYYNHKNMGFSGTVLLDNNDANRKLRHSLNFYQYVAMASACLATLLFLLIVILLAFYCRLVRERRRYNQRITRIVNSASSHHSSTAADYTMSLSSATKSPEMLSRASDLRNAEILTKMGSISKRKCLIYHQYHEDHLHDYSKERSTSACCYEANRSLLSGRESFSQGNQSVVSGRDEFNSGNPCLLPNKEGLSPISTGTQSKIDSTSLDSSQVGSHC